MYSVYLYIRVYIYIYVLYSLLISSLGFHKFTKVSLFLSLENNIGVFVLDFELVFVVGKKKRKKKIIDI